MRSAWLVLVLACSSESKSTPKPIPAPAPGSSKPAEGCLADGLGKLTNELDFDHECLDEPTCRHACEADDARACVAHAYALQKVNKSAEANRAFARGCKLGIAIGCTNYGAMLVTSTPDTDQCGRRLFERACQAGSSLGCGMLGRVMAKDANTPAEKSKARTYLEDLCNKQGGPTCRMLALHLENGDLGTSKPGEVEKLMRRACDGGDKDACGHTSAAATFHDN